MSRRAEARFRVGQTEKGVGMPVTAKLSKRFYEQFGDSAANELVDWFNSVDATYYAQIREINEANRAWIDARFGELAARMDAFEAKLDAKLSRLRSEMILWMFGFWTATVLPLAALELALHGAFSK